MSDIRAFSPLNADRNMHRFLRGTTFLGTSGWALITASLRIGRLKRCTAMRAWAKSRLGPLALETACYTAGRTPTSSSSGSPITFEEQVIDPSLADPRIIRSEMIRSIGTVLLVVVVTAMPGCARAEAPAGTYRYGIIHPSFGDIGVFTNMITRDGDRVIVATNLEVEVSLLFLVVHRVEAERTQIWRDGRLIGYDSRTTSVRCETARKSACVAGPWATPS